MPKVEVPDLDADTRYYIATELQHDVVNNPEGLERIRWNNRCVWMLMKRITDLETQLADATGQ